MLQEPIEPAWLDALGAVPGRKAYGAGRVGCGLAFTARWKQRDSNGTGLRAWAGNSFSSTGVNAVARHTFGAFDLSLRPCTLRLDGHTRVDAGKLLA